MANDIFLTLKGAKQGLISAGCSTKDSIGNLYQAWTLTSFTQIHRPITNHNLKSVYH
jgi:type VI secretion system Hcp family effector